MSKTIIALLPAIAAQIAWFLMSKTSQVRQNIWFIVIVALLLVGGILSAKYITNYLRQSNVDRSPVIMTLTSLMIIIIYVAIFFFTGCTVSVMIGL